MGFPWTSRFALPLLFFTARSGEWDPERDQTNPGMGLVGIRICNTTGLRLILLFYSFMCLQRPFDFLKCGIARHLFSFFKMWHCKTPFPRGTTIDDATYRRIMTFAKTCDAEYFAYTVTWHKRCFSCFYYRNYSALSPEAIICRLALSNAKPNLHMLPIASMALSWTVIEDPAPVSWMVTYYLT